MNHKREATPSAEVLAVQLRQLSRNLWWVWNPDAQTIFKELSPLVWERSNHNAVAVFREISQKELSARLLEPDFARIVRHVIAEFHAYMDEKKTWSVELLPDFKQPVAYFSAEYGMHESIPIYSGGLGILSGDHIKSASDLGLPFIGVGLFYRHGYFQQRIGPDGWQQELYPMNDPENLPVELVERPEGGRLLNSVEIGHSVVYFQTWKIQVGRAPLYLLDTNLPENDQHYQGLTSHVYGGDIDTRIGQEIMLGIGGVRLLRSLGIEPSVYHMNEGHSAFLVLELLREELKAGKTLEAAEKAVRGKCLFTTHTPVPAGHDRFSNDLMQHSLGKFWSSTGLEHGHLMSYGRVDPKNNDEQFTMTVLALKMSRAANGVSELHGRVSREMWKQLYHTDDLNEVPIGYITNGVHTPSWATIRAHDFWNKRLGLDWTDKLVNPKFWAKIDEDGLASDEELWALRTTLRRELVEFVRKRQWELHYRGGGDGPSGIERLLSPDILTVCFARRFATYKRAPLFFKHLEKMIPLFNNPQRPVQLIYAGKAHPRDNEGKKFIQQVVEFSRNPQLYGKVVFIENYDINVARHMVAGADVWLNNPRRPLEASGTSGMKGCIHGGLNFSILDGWWCEGYDGENGWAIGADYAEGSLEEQDERDFGYLYQTLTESIIPEYYDRDEHGIPRKWIARIRKMMKTLIPVYNTDRMVAEYAFKYYAFQT
ncbi:MAG: alpha-glucan family phosphorylase [Ignavibacteriae bacterium]|nr:alpha-glucan family phosphorylase [Ignavibacteriota bacterium]MCI0707937.1 alpha-glucan family phosphorylase [Ignavibacteriota bacterium]